MAGIINYSHFKNGKTNAGFTDCIAIGLGREYIGSYLL